MEIAILHKGDIRTKTAELLSYISPDEQTRDPKAGKGFCE
jgi:hypothetical protein